MNSTPKPLPRIYFISGLGGDDRLFMRLKENGLPFEVLPFLEPEKKESLLDYAKRMAVMMDTSQPFILGGVSFGGMLSCEMAKFMHPEFLFLISTVKSGSEFPFYLKFFRYLPIHRLLSGEFIKRVAPGVSHTIIGKENRAILDQMKREASPGFVEWAVNQAVWYRNRIQPKDFIHIHGTGDHLLRFRFVRGVVPIPKGSHVMVMDRASEILQVFNAELKRRGYETVQLKSGIVPEIAG